MEKHIQPQPPKHKVWSVLTKMVIFSGVADNIQKPNTQRRKETCKTRTSHFVTQHKNKLLKKKTSVHTRTRTTLKNQTIKRKRRSGVCVMGRPRTCACGHARTQCFSPNTSIVSKKPTHYYWETSQANANRVHITELNTNKHTRTSLIFPASIAANALTSLRI